MLKVKYVTHVLRQVTLRTDLKLKYWKKIWVKHVRKKKEKYSLKMSIYLNLSIRLKLIYLNKIYFSFT